MQYQYNAGESENYPARMGVERYFSADVDEETGVFDVPDDHDRIDEIQERLEELGHERVGSDTDETNPLEGWTEDDIVEADGNTIKSLAGDFDDLDGRKAADPLREALILKLRGE